MKISNLIPSKREYENSLLIAIFFIRTLNFQSRLRSKIFDVANDSILKLHPCSQIQIVGSPFSAIYEQGKTVRRLQKFRLKKKLQTKKLILKGTSTPFPDDFISKTSVNFGQVK